MTSYNHKSRNDLYTLLAVGKKQLGWDESKYRLFLQAHGAQQHNGKYSAASMNTSDIIIAIEAMKAAGFVPTRKSGKKPDWREPRIRKITALWCALADAGEVRERGYSSMERWCRSLIKTSKLDWASGDGLNQCIEALKSWCHRKGVQISDG